MLTGQANLGIEFVKSEVRLIYGAHKLNLRSYAAPGYLFNFFYNLMHGLFGPHRCNPSVQALIQILMSLDNLLYVKQHLPKR